MRGRGPKPVGRARVWRMPPPGCEVRISGLAEIAEWSGMDYWRLRRAIVHMQTDLRDCDSAEARMLRREFPELCARCPVPMEARR